jgi:hypothetical protein
MNAIAYRPRSGTSWSAEPVIARWHILKNSCAPLTRISAWRVSQWRYSATLRTRRRRYKRWVGAEVPPTPKKRSHGDSGGGRFAIGEDWFTVGASNRVLDGAANCSKQKATPKSQSVNEEPIMTFDNSTPAPQTNEERGIREIRFASPRTFYQLHPDVGATDVHEQLQARLGQLSAMLRMMMDNGCGSENSFDLWSSKIRADYIWSCVMVADECEGLAEHI